MENKFIKTTPLCLLVISLIKNLIGDKEEAKSANYSTITMLGITALVTFTFVPVVLKTLNGNNRILFILRQLWVLIYLVLTFLCNMTVSSRVSLSGDNKFFFGEKVSSIYLESVKAFFNISANEEKPYEENKVWNNLSVDQTYKLEKSLNLAKYFAYYNLYFMSLMQSVDVYKMICKPFDYNEFCRGKLMKYISVGACMCLLASSDQIVSWYFGLAFMDLISNESLQAAVAEQKAYFGLSVFDFLKTILIKILYSWAAIRLAWLSRAGMKESSKMSKRQSTICVRIFYYSLIPLFLSLLFSVHEVFLLLKPFIGRRSYLEINIYFPKDDVITGIQVSVITFGSLLYCIGYVILFPNVKNVFSCNSE